MTEDGLDKKQSRLKREWVLLGGGVPSEPVQKLSQELGIPPLTALLLVNRGISNPSDAAEFLNPTLDRLNDPYLLPDAKAAVERLAIALRENQRILIHGDYDGDGITSTALWTKVLRAIRRNLHHAGDEDGIFGILPYVPHRQRDGYDLREAVIARAQREHTNLILTTDCGIQRMEEAEMAREAGIDLIITDHHQPGSELPQCTAVVNPQRADSRYPFRDLAGVGVAFRLGEALAQEMGLKVERYRSAFLDLAAIGTVTDIMPILGENRVILAQGLRALASTRKPGLKSLMQVAGCDAKHLDSRSIGFRIGPRLNAVGRMNDSQYALDLLMATESEQAERLARLLDASNSDRQLEQKRVLGEVVQRIAGSKEGFDPEMRCIVLSGEEWHSGVIGIVASRVVELFYRPTILISMNRQNGIGRGSARSIRPFHLLKAITQASDLLIEYGGHSHAAGFAIERDAIPEFSHRMREIASIALTPEDLVPTLDIEAEISLADVNDGLMAAIAQLEPFGRGNPEPIFCARDLTVVKAEAFGSDGSHLRIVVQDDKPARYAAGNQGAAQSKAIRVAIEWGSGDVLNGKTSHSNHLMRPLKPASRVDICFIPEYNQYRGETGIQLRLLDYVVH